MKTHDIFSLAHLGYFHEAYSCASGSSGCSCLSHTRCSFTRLHTVSQRGSARLRALSYLRMSRTYIHVAVERASGVSTPRALLKTLRWVGLHTPCAGCTQSPNAGQHGCALCHTCAHAWKHAVLVSMGTLWQDLYCYIIIYL